MEYLCVYTKLFMGTRVSEEIKRGYAFELGNKTKNNRCPRRVWSYKHVCVCVCIPPPPPPPMMKVNFLYMFMCGPTFFVATKMPPFYRLPLPFCYPDLPLTWMIIFFFLIDKCTNICAIVQVQWG